MYYYADDVVARMIAQGMTVEDGTYRIIGSWVGNERVPMIERVDYEVAGYEVGIRPVPKRGEGYPLNLTQVGQTTRIGIWTNPETNEVCIDEVVHVEQLGLADELGRKFSQLCIWDNRNREAVTLNVGV